MTYKIDDQKEKAALVGVDEKDLDELRNLVKTAGGETILTIPYRERKIDPAYYIGSGKVLEIKDAVETIGANLVVFDNELNPVQQRNLEETIDTRVVDRNQVILDIFARHAHSLESKLQVELAQLKYMLPRLRGKGIDMSRLAGGIGTRGPGETKLEVDRRRIEQKIYRLNVRLSEIEKTRKVQQQNRQDPLVSLVGYTNAGKSTLMNLLTDADTEVADKLFATLDSTMRQLDLPIGRTIIISDTVGFINKLPHQLVASFRTTLSEIKAADILLHVIDASNENLEKHIKVVENELKKLDIQHSNLIKVFNKIDKLTTDARNEIEIYYPNSILISAKEGLGKNELLARINDLIKARMELVNLKIPYSDAGLIEKIHSQGKVYQEKYEQKTIDIEALLPLKLASKLAKYIVYSAD